jgi:hypothetical protein
MYPIRKAEEEFQKKAKPSGQFAGHAQIKRAHWIFFARN